MMSNQVFKKIRGLLKEGKPDSNGSCISAAASNDETLGKTHNCSAIKHVEETFN